MFKKLLIIKINQKFLGFLQLCFINYFKVKKVTFFYV